MEERWLNIAPGAKEKQAQRFDAWSATDTIPFIDDQARSVFLERASCIRDAVQLKKRPERIPVCPSLGHYPVEYAGITWRDALYDLDKIRHAWVKFHEDFHPDASGPPVNIPWGPALDILDMTSYRWPGGTLDEHHEFQFVEGEYMQAGEYHELIDDPTGFFLTRYFPRTFGSLKGFEKTGYLPAVNEVAKIASVFGPFGSEEMLASARKMGQAAEELLKWTEVIREISMSLKAGGTPSYVGGYTKAPFDVIGDCLRGTRGVMTDMFRNRDLLIEACERLVPFMIKDGINACNASGHVMLMMPLHKGADAFMSEKQFATFYWPSLRKVIIGLADAGIVPVLFAEGSYNKRLDIIADLPAGIAVWWFENTDMTEAKKALDGICCISGNVPLDLLCTATPHEVRDNCKKLIDTAGPGGGFILSTGAGMQGSRAGNVKVMIEFSKEYGRY